MQHRHKRLSTISDSKMAPGVLLSASFRITRKAALVRKVKIFCEHGHDAGDLLFAVEVWPV